MTWVWNHSRSRHGTRLVLLAIARHGEQSSVSVGELADMTLLGERAVQTAIRELMALEELAVDFRPGAASRFRVLPVDRPPLPLPPPTRREPVSPETRLFVFDRDGHRCVWCGSAEDLTIDHVYPQSLGGAHTEDNLQTLCRSHNSSKGARAGWSPSALPAGGRS